MIRTDLALEAKELAGERGQQAGKLEGVRSEERERVGIKVTEVEILDGRGEKQLGKPRGRYVTLELERHGGRPVAEIGDMAQAVAEELGALLPEGKGGVVVAGLGNRYITPDAVGPRTVEHTLVTRHLRSHLPEHFEDFRSVAAIAPGVLGVTGMESMEVICGVCERVKPEFLLVVDALASRSAARLCSTVQLTDTGIAPGSGVGNSRAALNRETMGIPVIAVGVPTVVEAATLAADIVSASGGTAGEELFREAGGGLIVTPKDIDRQIDEISRLLGLGINMALHDMPLEEVSALIG